MGGPSLLILWLTVYHGPDLLALASKFKLPGDSYHDENWN